MVVCSASVELKKSCTALPYKERYSIMEENVISPNISPLEKEALDPRIQVELENLNAATDEINRLEATLEEANGIFRGCLNETSLQLQALSKKFGSCIEKARPFYEAKEVAKNLQLECQRAAVKYQRANAVHQAARETITLAEERFTNLKDRERQGGKERKFDAAWQEMLNHATIKIMEAEAQKSASEREHLRRAAAYTAAEADVQDLQRRLKSVITKSRPYFSYRSATQVKLEAQKDRIHRLQKDITVAKSQYSFSLRNLEQISEEIHELRRVNMKREPGVGAEMDDCTPFIEKAPIPDSLLESNTEEEQKYWSTLKKKLVEMPHIEDDKLERAKKAKKIGDDHHLALALDDDFSFPFEDVSPKEATRIKGETEKPSELVQTAQVMKEDSRVVDGEPCSVEGSASAVLSDVREIVLGSTLPHISLKVADVASAESGQSLPDKLSTSRTRIQLTSVVLKEAESSPMDEINLQDNESLL